MCSRFSQTYRIELAARWARIFDPKGALKNHTPKYNIAPTDEAVVIIDEGNGLQVEPMIFGMIPSWAKDAKMGLSCINARSETIAEKPSFRSPFKKRRCLIPVDGYFEWKRDGKLKMPFRFVLTSGELFSLAGVWDEWTSPHGRTCRSFAVITTEPDNLNATIHDRMPVILTEKDEAAWLSPQKFDTAELLSLLKPYNKANLTTYAVSPTMNSSHNKGPECIQKI